LEIKLQRDLIFNAIQSLQGVVETKTTSMPILQNVLIETLSGKKSISISGTNLDISLKGNIDAEVIKTGKLTLNARKLFDIIRELAPGAIVSLVEEENQRVKIEGGNAKFSLPSLPYSDFPTMPDKAETEPHKIPSKKLAEMIKRTMFAISQDETRYTYNGVFMESENQILRLVATDGHRLALIEREEEGFQLANGVILHKKGLGELTKLLQANEDKEEEVSVFITENHAIFVTANNELSARLIEGEFPKYQQVIPHGHQHNVIIDRNDLLSALRRVSLFSSETRLVKFTFKKGILNLSTSGSEFGEADESVECDFKGKELTIGFNYRYCTDVLSILTEKNIVVEIKDALSPGVFRPSGENSSNDDKYTYVVMPMRV
tara:strand:- start:4775 stop:5905 length:1131 start_codon:yes stop_codon:yes gene_type:complete